MSSTELQLITQTTPQNRDWKEVQVFIPPLPFLFFPPSLPACLFLLPLFPFSSSPSHLFLSWVSYAAWDGLKPTVFRPSLPGTFVYHHPKLEPSVVQHPPEDSRADPIARAP